MAYKAEIGSELKEFFGDQVKHFWAISHSVGWGNYNFYEEVIMVQYLLNKCAGKKILKTDGLFGSKTAKAIKDFQNSTNYFFIGGLKADGRVSAMDGSRAYTGSGDNYTIHLLNWMFFCEKRIYFDDPRMDPDLPNSLCLMVSDYF